MSRRTTTVICAIGFADKLEAAADAGANVAFEPAPPVASDTIKRTAAAWSLMAAARRRSTIYVLVDLDPLKPVVQAWSARLSSESHDLETAIGLVGTDPLPDYYLIAADLEGNPVHWYLDLVYRQADRRVLPVAPRVSAILRCLGRLPAGPELPSAAELAAHARTYVPPPVPTVASAREPRLGR